MKFKTILSWAMIASVFMDDFIILRYRIPFDFYVYYLFFIVSIVYYIRSKGGLKLLPGWFSISIGAMIASTILICTLNNSFSMNVFKQIFGLLFTSIAYYTFLEYNNFEIRRLFRMYVYLALFVSLEGLLEEVLNLAGIHINEKMRLTSSGFYRIFGIMGEPYFLAVILIPAMFYTFYKMTIFERILSKYNNLFITASITLCFIFTFSSAGFLGVVGVVVFWMINKKYLSLKSWKILLLPFLLSVFLAAFQNVQKEWKEFNIKFTQTLGAFSNNSTDKDEIAGLNTSSFALYSNFVIAKASFLENPMTGTGLGTHDANYKKYFSRFFDDDFIVRYGIFNMADANSLFIRMMSETGLIGLSLFFSFLIRNFLGRKGYDDPETRDYTLINQGIFIWFVVRIVRTGNYFGNGFFLFFFMYYACRKIVNRKKREKKAYALSELSAN